MSRVIRFRVWDGEDMHSPALIDFAKDNSALNIMQCTGLIDRNGKFIYEGDVIEGTLIKYSLPTMGEIVFDNYWGSFANKNEAGNTLIGELDQIRVIGNIHANPELMKAKEGV